MSQRKERTARESVTGEFHRFETQSLLPGSFHAGVGHLAGGDVQCRWHLLHEEGVGRECLNSKRLCNGPHWAALEAF